jgi:hypothetical protein
MWYHGARMSGVAAEPSARLRRARREDIPALLGVVGGPEPARRRALRRVLKTLAADVYVLDRERRIDGVVAVFYRRSLRQGGLVATIDALETFSTETGVDDATDRDALLDHALDRARRRGCVAIDTASDVEELQRALALRGFQSGAASWMQMLPPRPHEREDEGGEG